MSEIVQLPDNNSGNGGLPFSIPIGGGGGGLFGSGQTNLMDLFGFAIIASIFPNLFGNRGGFPGMNNDLVMNAVTAEGAATRSAVQNLAASTGQDFNVVYGAVQNVQNLLSSIGANQGMSTLQVINSIQSGNAGLAAQLSQCCCDNRLLTTQQGYEAQIRTLEQTNQLGSQADRNSNNILAAIGAQTVAMNEQFCAARERDMQEKIDALLLQNSQLRGQIDNANQTAAITGYVNSIVTPLANKVNEIAAKQLPTVNVQWPQLQAVNTTPYMGGVYANGYYGNGAYYGNGFAF